MKTKIIVIALLMIGIGLFGGNWDVVNAQGTIPPVIPIPVTGGSIIAAGLGHSCLTTADGYVVCWGLNDSGQVGDGTFKNQWKGVFVKDLTGVFNLSLGSKHSCALLTDGTVWCWGLNTSGQLGNGTTENSNIPVQVTGLPDVVASISAGQDFTCATLQDQTIWCWGDNSNGQLNDGTSTNTSKPVKSLFAASPAQISGGQFETVGEASGQVSMWAKKDADNIFGLNDAFLISGNRFAPGGCAVRGAGSVDCWTADNKPINVKGILDAIFVEAGLDHACALDGISAPVCWGKNNFGEVGDMTNIDKEEATYVVQLESVTALAVGGHHACVLIGDGTAKCWGYNAFGQLGNETFNNSSYPVTVILPEVEK